MSLAFSLCPPVFPVLRFPVHSTHLFIPVAATQKTSRQETEEKNAKIWIKGRGSYVKETFRRGTDKGEEQTEERKDFERE